MLSGRDLLLCAKHLFVRANGACGRVARLSQDEEPRGAVGEAEADEDW
jgi:hypothetical protein